MLKKENYEVKGFVLPVAYAMAQVDTTREVATFYIGASREKLLNGEYIEKKNLHFNWDRKENPVVSAYNEAKGCKIVKQIDFETGLEKETTQFGIFFGWVDDIS